MNVQQNSGQNFSNNLQKNYEALVTISKIVLAKV